MKDTLLKMKNSLIPLYGKGETEAIIRIIFHYLKGWNLTDILIHKNEPLSDYIKNEIEIILKRLLTYEPIQYITGEARFHGMMMKVEQGVLIPRPETEQLVDLIIDENRGREDLKVLDICTGSGCIALALARNLPFSQVLAIDFSPVALKIAKENSEILKTKIKIIKADIFEWTTTEKFDIIVSNPPYVMDKEALQMEKNVLNYEPHEALFVRDDNPLVFYKRITDIAKDSLKENGKLYFEINPMVSGILKQMMGKKGLRNIEIYKDSFGQDRFIVGQLN